MGFYFLLPKKSRFYTKWNFTQKFQINESEKINKTLYEIKTYMKIVKPTFNIYWKYVIPILNHENESQERMSSLGNGFLETKLTHKFHKCLKIILRKVDFLCQKARRIFKT